MSLPTDNRSVQPGDRFDVPILTETQVRIKPLVALETPEPIADAKGSLTSDQLREIAKRCQPPASWLEEEEEQLF